MQVIKRDESVQEFSFDKVEEVIKKAFASVSQEVPDKFMDQLKEVFDSTIKKNDSINVEEIQDIIQKELIKRNKYEVVDSFINYRRKHAEARENKSDLIKQIQKKLNATDVENQNANLDEASFGGRIGEAASEVCKHEALKNMSKMARKNHEENMIYIHDLSHYAVGDHNCLTIPIDKALAIGFRTRQTDVRRAGSVNTASQLCAVVMQCQSLEQFGGVAYSHIDWSMVPYIRKSFKKHFRNGVEYFVHKTKAQANQIVDKIWADNGAIYKELPNDDRINYLDEMLKMTLPVDRKFYVPKKTLFNWYYVRQMNKAFDYAWRMTQDETYQAVEGLFHNLNTLNWGAA